MKPFFSTYLNAKISVDDRALNHQVWASFEHHLPQATPQQPLQLLEIGAGIGTMIPRLHQRGLLNHTVYTAIDMSADTIAFAGAYLPRWAITDGFEVEQLSPTHLYLRKAEQTVEIKLIATDIFPWIAQQPPAQWDGVLAHAFLDLVDVPTLLPNLFQLLKAKGLFYFSLNFDGETVFMPEIDPQLEQAIMHRYHASMDARVGDSRTGRKLFEYLPAAGASIINAGSSDWVVFPQQGVYPAKEATFLRCILQFFEESLGDMPGIQPWLATRRAQIERGELVYIAHQLDVVGCIGSIK